MKNSVSAVPFVLCPCTSYIQVVVIKIVGKYSSMMSLCYQNALYEKCLDMDMYLHRPAAGSCHSSIHSSISGLRTKDLVLVVYYTVDSSFVFMEPRTERQLKARKRITENQKALCQGLLFIHFSPSYQPEVIKKHLCLHATLIY